MSNDIGEYMPDVLARTMVTSECWIWLGTRSTKGYGQIVRAGRHIQVHRIAHEAEVGPIPEGDVIDHTCHDPAVCVGGNCVHRLCVNPAHLAARSNAENLARQTPAYKTHCVHGHELSGSNVRFSKSGTRSCRTCADRSTREYKRNPNLESSKIRAWARERGIPVGTSGRISAPVVDAYRAEQAAEAAA